MPGPARVRPGRWVSSQVCRARRSGEGIMSLDNISQLGGQGLDELVPSRYALRVGDIEVLVISDGVLPISAETIAYNADSADLAGRQFPAAGGARVAAERSRRA